MIPNQILSQSLLREVNRPENEGPFSKPTVPQPIYKERDIISRLNDEDKKFDSMRLKHAPTNIQKMNDLMDLKRKRDIKPTEEDLDYQKLLKQLEYATARNAQYKQDINMIDTALDSLDPRKKMLVGTDIDKKFALESLRTKRMQIRDKEKIFIDQLQQFHDYYALNERNRIEKGIVNEDFLRSKQSKIRDLKLLHEQLDYDKTNFLDQFDKIRSGYSIKPQPYFTSVGASTLGLGGNPSFLAIDYDLGRVRDKIQDDERRIEKMKQDNMYYYTRNHLQVDPEEAFGSNKVNFKQEIKYLMDTNKYAPSSEDKYNKLRQIRENLEKLGAEKGLNLSKVKLQFIEETPESIQQYQSTLRDIENLRQDYIQSGGTDPEFLMNLQNLEQFYKQTRFNPVNKDLIKMSQGLPISNQDPPGFYYNSSVHNPSPHQQLPQQNTIAGNNSFVMMGGQPSVAGNQGQQLRQNLLEKYGKAQQEDSITQHPIYEYLPETFKKQVIELEQKNDSMRHDLSSVFIPPAVNIPTSLVDGKSLIKSSNSPGTDVNNEEQMLNYVRGQEAELLLNMSRLNPNQVEYNAKHSQYLQVQQLKSSLERSIIDKKVKSALQGANITANQSTLGNTSIVYGGGGVDQSMNVGHLQRASTQYSPNEGFMVRWDWIGSLPINYAKIKLNFGLFRKGDNFFAYRDTVAYPTEQETYRSNKCLFLQKEVIRDVQPFPDTVLYCEFWGFQQTSEGVPSKPEVIGWSMHEIFDYNGQLNPGKYKLPFYSKVFQPNELFNEGLPYMSNSALFIRICLPMDPYFDVDSTVLLQNEYRVQDLHIRKKKVLKLDENTNQYVPDISNRYLYANDKNNTMQDPNQSSIQNYDQSTMLPNISISNAKPTVLRDDNKPPDFSQFSQQGTPQKGGDLQNKNDLKQPSPNQTVTSQFTGKRTVTIAPSYVNSDASRIMSNTSIEVGGLTRIEQPRSLRIRLLNLLNVKTDVKTIQIRSVIFSKNEIVLTRTKNPSADNVKLEEVKVSKTNEIQMNVQTDQDIDWKEIMQKQTKRDLEKIVFYCAIFKCVVGKEDELLGWLVWPIYKVENDQKMVNSGVFTTSIFKKPAQKPPFLEKKEKSEIQMKFEIEAVGGNAGDQKVSTNTKSQMNIEDEDRLSSQPMLSQKVIDIPNANLDNNKKLVIDLNGLSKYLLTKNDLKYKMEVVKDGQPITDENGHKCIEEQNVNIIEKGKDIWKFDCEQKFEIGQEVLMKNFSSDSSYSKGFIMTTIMTKDKGEVIGVCKMQLFKSNSSQFDEGRSKVELVKIEKNGTEKPLRYILDYTINYLNIDQLNRKVYNPNKGLKVSINLLTNYREKFEATYQFKAMVGKENLLNNYSQPCVVHGSDFVVSNAKEKIIKFDDKIFTPLDLERLKDTYRRKLDEIYMLFEIIIDKSEGKGDIDIEELFGWYAHPLFIEGKYNLGKFNEQLFKPPIAIDSYPIDPKKMKKYLVKMEFELSEEFGQPPNIQLNAPPTLSNKMSEVSNASNKFNIYIESLQKIQFSANATTKLAIIFGDDIFLNDNGQPCSFTGEPTKPEGDVLQLNEEYDIDLDIEVLKNKYPKQLDQFYFFINILDSNSKPLLWFISKVFEKGDLRVGTFVESLLLPPVSAKFSLGFKNAKKSTSILKYEIKKGHSDDQSFEEV